MENEKKKVINTAEEVRKDPMRFFDDSIVVGTSNAIELQESQGQASFVKSDTLPTEGPFYNREPEKNKAILESFGIKFLGPVPGDSLFQFIELPAGWKKIPTDHSMWSDIVDDQGRIRIAVFYKAAFYDRNAHFHIERRFSAALDYKARDNNIAIAHVKDAGKVIFTTEPIKLDNWQSKESLDICDSATKKATEWLTEHYPDWQNPGAYWDLENPQ